MSFAVLHNIKTPGSLQMNVKPIEFYWSWSHPWAAWMWFWNCDVAATTGCCFSQSDFIPLLLFCPQRLCMFTTNSLPFLLPSPLILYQCIHLLLCRSVRLFYSIPLPACLSVSPSVCGKCLRAARLQRSCSRFSTADSSPRANPPLAASSDSTSLSKCGLFSRQDNIDLTTSSV